MSILKKRNTLKLAATLMLVGMMAGAFAMHTKAAFATPAVACSPTTNIGIGGNCDMLVSADLSNSLWFNNEATVNVANPFPGVNAFTFTTTVIDTRTTPLGWQLQATSPGMQVGGAGTPISLTIGDAGSTCLIGGIACTGFSSTVATLPNTAGAATPLPFAQVTSAAGPGTFNLTTVGSVDLSGATVGDYDATITISLVNTFS